VAITVCDIIIKVSESFELVVDGFSQTETWNFLHDSYVTITSYLIETLKFIFTLDVSTINIVSSISQLLALIITHTIPPVSVVYIVSEQLKIAFSSNKTISLGIIVSEILENLQTFDVRPIDLVANAIVARFNLLGDFDPSTLATLDVQDLGDLDYTVV